MATSVDSSSVSSGGTGRSSTTIVNNVVRAPTDPSLISHTPLPTVPHQYITSGTNVTPIATAVHCAKVITFGAASDIVNNANTISSPSAAASTLLTLSSSSTTTSPPTMPLSHPVKIMSNSNSVIQRTTIFPPQNQVSHVRKQSLAQPARGPLSSQYMQVSPPPTLSHMDMARPPHEG